MTHIFGFFLALAIAVCTGFGATWFAIEYGHGFERVDTAQWSTWTKSGSVEADPYAKANIAKTGEIPLNAAEGLTLISQGDDEGRRFDPACTYMLTATLPRARLWTLVAYLPNGQIAANKANRYSLTSEEIVRDTNGNFEITVSSEVQPGNWLPVAADQPYLLMLRLYDTTVGSTAAEVQAAIIIKNRKKACA